MKEENRRITKQELQKIYNVDRTTVECWIRNYGLPMIVISSHSKYVRESDLLDWENKMISKNKLSRVLES